MKHNYLKKAGTISFLFLFCLSFINAQIHITDAAGLDNMRNDAAGSYILDNDIDLTSFDWVAFEFTGTLDGNGYSIKNLEVELNDENAGLFSVLNGATVKNLGLTDVYIFCTNNGGALAGKALSSNIEKCFATGEVNSGGLTGGLFGFTENSNVSECYTAITVNGHDHVGGITGHMNGGLIENCYTNSTVYSDGWQVGGIVGWAQNAGATITKCAAYGTVKSEGGFTGGILGIADGGEKVVEITECLSLQSKLETVAPDIEKTYRIIANHAAGVYSKNYGLATTEISDPYKFAWEDDVNGKDGASITDEQALSADFFADSLSWDFTDVWVLSAAGLKLQWEPKEYVHISTAAEFSDIRNDASGWYILDNDIDLASTTWEPFDFFGKIDGNGKAIQNLEVINGEGEAGLFYYLENAEISNLKLENVYVECSGTGGALAKLISGSVIEKVYVSGEVVTNGLAGGLVGEAGNSTIKECYSVANVTGRDHVGGLVGHMNGGSIENCYVKADVYSTAWQVGGIVGWAQNEGTSISKCAVYGTVKSEQGFTGGILGIADGSEKVVEITECLALHTKLETVAPDIEKTYRIIANHAAGLYSKNYGLASTEISDPYKFEWENDVNGKDGASISMAEQVLVPQFYADSLSWDFSETWELGSNGPRLQWIPVNNVGTKTLIPASKAHVYAAFGQINIEDAEENASIKVYSISGQLLYEARAKSSLETVPVEGLSIVVVESRNARSAHKIVNL
jgi:M26 IgA1-specific Metallo-endopeptidase N-terminal region/The GLUG motif